MGEKEIIVDELKLTYDGLFKVHDLYNVMNKWFTKRGYIKREIKSIESVKKTGKYVEVEWLPWKKVTDYAKNEIKVRFMVRDMTEVEVKKGKSTINMNKGKIQLVFFGYLTTDYENRWEQKPLLMFIRTLFDKFVHQGYTHKWKKDLKQDITDLNDTVKAFLNLQRYR